LIPPASRRERFLRDPVPIRLGNLAANLARIRSFSQAGSLDGVRGLIEESRHFADWAVAGASDDALALLRRLLRHLTRWLGALSSILPSEESRRTLGEEAATWSRRLLGQAGLGSQ